jgi:hypothetical protein
MQCYYCNFVSFSETTTWSQLMFSSKSDAILVSGHMLNGKLSA